MAYTITEAQAVELLKIAEALVGNHVKIASISETDREDYVQDLMLLMVQHQDDWSVPPGVKFESFANTVMSKRLISIWRKGHRKRNVMTGAQSLNSIFIDDNGEEAEFITFLTEDGMLHAGETPDRKRRKLIAEVRFFVNTLPADERRLCNLLMFYSQAEAAIILKMNRKTVWHMVQRIKTKMLQEEIFQKN